MNHDNFWSKAISNEGKRILGIKNGPSVSFVIGAYWYLKEFSNEDIDSLECISKFLRIIISSKGNRHICIKICNTIGTYIITELNNENNGEINIENIEEYTSLLRLEVGRFIKEHRFSCDRDDNHFRNFSQEEIKAINLVNDIQI